MVFLHRLPLLAEGGPDWLRILIGSDAAPQTAVNITLVLAGMLLITKGGDLFTDSAVAIARATRIPPVIIGATIVSMATTFPEFMVSLTGTLNGTPDFAVGNALGSCCCNIGLIVGSCALLKGYLDRRRGAADGIPVSRVTLQGPGAFMLTAGVAVWLFSMFDSGSAHLADGEPSPYGITRWQGGLLVVLLVLYLAYSMRSALGARFESDLTSEEEEADEEIREHIFKTVAVFLAGAALVVLGSRLLVANSEKLALDMGVPKLIVGLTVLAVGTSLPEYVISLMAVIKGHGALGIGNIIGANVLNICWVVATCALISPLPIRWQTIVLDGPVVLLLMILLPALAWKREQVAPWMGGVLFGVYCVYLALMFTFFVGS